MNLAEIEHLMKGLLHNAQNSPKTNGDCAEDSVFRHQATFCPTAISRPSDAACVKDHELVINVEICTHNLFNPAVLGRNARARKGETWSAHD